MLALIKDIQRTDLHIKLCLSCSVLRKSSALQKAFHKMLCRFLRSQVASFHNFVPGPPKALGDPAVYVVEFQTFDLKLNEKGTGLNRRPGVDK